MNDQLFSEATKLMMVADMMDRKTREENKAYIEEMAKKDAEIIRMREQIRVRDEELVQYDQLVTDQIEIVRALEHSLGEFAYAIETQQVQLHAMLPGRLAGFVVGRDHMNIQRVLLVDLSENGEYPTVQDVVDLVTEEELDSDTDSDITVLEDEEM